MQQLLEVSIAARAAASDGDDLTGFAATRAGLRDDLTLALADDAVSVLVAVRAGLTDDEMVALSVARAIETDEHLQMLVVAMTSDRDRNRLEVGLAEELLGDGTTVALGPESGLQRAGLITLEARGPFSRARVVIAPRLLWALAGDGAPDPDLPVDAEWLQLDPDDDAEGPERDLLVSGGDRVRRRQAALRDAGRVRCLVVSSVRSAEEWAAVVREATIGNAAVIVECTEAPADVGRWWIERSTHLPWVLSSPDPLAVTALPQREWHALTAADATPTAAEWESAVGPEIERRHNLSRKELDEFAHALRIVGGDEGEATRRMVSSKLASLAVRIRPRHGWDDLVLSPTHTMQVRNLVSRYRNAARVYDDWGFAPAPSRGLVALFSGPSGTGKTLAAEVVAHDLGLDLYKLDLSSVLSKWIGETEKNLDSLFDAAGSGNFVLFFDEADALFAKRAAVNDSHDRYANVETSYLLQRLERYDGLVVLATNYEKNIDEAFLRRIHVRVSFGLPDEPARLEIWRHLTRSAAALGDDVDLEWLATRFEVSGASIKNASLAAAFLAADHGDAIGMEHLVRAMAGEFRKLGRLITEEQFGPWFDTVAPEEL